MCGPLVEFFKSSGAPRPTSKKVELMRAIQTFIHQIESAPATSVTTPAIVVQALLRTCATCDDDWYRPRQQADAAECLQYLLEGIHDAVYRTVRIKIEGTPKTATEFSQIKALQSWSTFFTKEYSPIVENFYGQTQIHVRCETCRTISERYEPWLMIKAPIPGSKSEGTAAPDMRTCLDDLYAPETLEGYECETCKAHRTATIFTRISRLPNILVLTIKRFTNDGRKIRGTIAWDTENINFRDWMAFTRDPFTNRRLQTKYQTFAVIEHNGSAMGGHYRMFGRGRDEGSNTWIEYDDDGVSKAAAAVVVSPDSYVIFLSPC